MKRFLFALGTLAMLTFTACDDSASSGESYSSNGSGSNGTSVVKGSFPPNGDEGFYCLVTDGTNADGSYWNQGLFRRCSRTRDKSNGQSYPCAYRQGFLL